MQFHMRLVHASIVHRGLHDRGDLLRLAKGLNRNPRHRIDLQRRRPVLHSDDRRLIDLALHRLTPPDLPNRRVLNFPTRTRIAALTHGVDRAQPHLNVRGPGRAGADEITWIGNLSSEGGLRGAAEIPVCLITPAVQRTARREILRPLTAPCRDFRLKADETQLDWRGEQPIGDRVNAETDPSSQPRRRESLTYRGDSGPNLRAAASR